LGVSGIHEIGQGFDADQHESLLFRGCLLEPRSDFLAVLSGRLLIEGAAFEIVVKGGLLL